MIKPNTLLTISSLLSILLMTVHFADDIVRGLSAPGPENAFAAAILVVWLYGTLMFSERLPGYIIMLLGAVFAAAMPVLHMSGKSYPEIARSSGGLFFICTLLALGVTGTFSFILAARGMWNLRRTKSESS